MLKNNKKKVFILGGEGKVNVKGNGKGGRNKQATLLALGEMKKKNLISLFYLVPQMA